MTLCRCFREIERVDYIMEVLTRCRHNGFPVVRSSLSDNEDSGDFDAAGQGASRSGSLQGVILRSQILVMLRHQVSPWACAIVPQSQLLSVMKCMVWQGMNNGSKIFLQKPFCLLLNIMA